MPISLLYLTSRSFVESCRLMKLLAITSGQGTAGEIINQQNQIEQRILIEAQQRQIESMKKIICQTNKGVDFCKE